MNCFNVVFMVFPLKSKAYIHANVFYLENTDDVAENCSGIVENISDKIVKYSLCVNIQYSEVGAKT